jgi:hypothetical protein
LAGNVRLSGYIYNKNGVKGWFLGGWGVWIAARSTLTCFLGALITLQCDARGNVSLLINALNGSSHLLSLMMTLLLTLLLTLINRAWELTHQCKGNTHD